MTINTKLLIENFSDYINIKFPYFFVLLIFTLHIIQSYFLYGIYIFNKTIVDINFLFNGFIWIIPFVIVNIFSLFFIKTIKKNLLDNTKKLEEFLKHKYITNEEITKYYANNKQIIIYVIPIISFIFQIYFLIINPAPWWNFQHLSSNFVFYYSLSTTINTVVSYLIICSYAYVCICTTLILHKTIKNLRGIKAEKVELVPWNVIGNTSFLVSISWIITLSPMLIILVGSGALWWWVTLQMVGYALVSLFLFLFPLYTSYTTINEVKHDVLLDYKQDIWNIYELIQNDNISSTQFTNLTAQIRHYELYENRIKKISPWPIEISKIIQFIFALAATLLPIIY